MSLLTLPWRIASFVVWFAWQIIIGSAAVLADVLTPGVRAEPLVVRMSLSCRTDLQVTGIASLITLTPGTLTIGVEESASGDRTLLVHALYPADPQAALEELHTMERRMLQAFSLRSPS